MDVESLRMAVEVAEHRSFAAVARRRDVAPSSVSRSVAALEESLGFEVFTRSTRRLRPTEAGEAFLKRVGPALEELDQAAMEARGGRSTPRGRLRVVVHDDVASAWFSTRVPAVLRRFPGLALDLEAGGRTDPVDEETGVSVVTSAAPPTTDGRSAALAPVTWRAVATRAYLASKGRPVSPFDLRGHDCLRRSDSGDAAWYFRPVGRPGAREQAVAVDGPLSASSLGALVRAARAGMGVALVPRWAITAPDESSGFVDLFPRHEVAPRSAFDEEVWLVLSSSARRTTKATAVVDFLATAEDADQETAVARP